MSEVASFTPEQFLRPGRRKTAPRADVPSMKHLCAFSDYQAANAHVFPTKASLDWFYRTHRQRLVEAGAVLLIAARLFVDVPKFEREAVEIGRSLATRGID